MNLVVKNCQVHMHIVWELRFFEKHVVSSSASTVNAYSSNPNQVRKWLNKISEAKSYIGNEDKRIAEFSNEKKNI